MAKRKTNRKTDRWEVVLEQAWETKDDRHRRIVVVQVEPDDGESETLDLLEGPEDLLGHLRFEPENREFEFTGTKFSDWVVVEARPLR